MMMSRVFDPSLSSLIAWNPGISLIRIGKSRSFKKMKVASSSAKIAPRQQIECGSQAKSLDGVEVS
jgi:hypothetical protein